MQRKKGKEKEPEKKRKETDRGREPMTYRIEKALFPTIPIPSKRTLLPDPHERREDEGEQEQAYACAVLEIEPCPSS